MALMDVGICSWCIDRHDALRAIELAHDQFGFSCVQLGFFSLEAIRNADARTLAIAAQEHQVPIVSTFAAFEREDYTSIETIAQTGGYLFDDEFEQRKDVTCRVADLSAALGSRFVATHIGTVPQNAQSASYDKLVERTGQIADELLRREQTLLVETGRESAQALGSLLDCVGRDNISINYDPGNFVVYGSDDPVRALARLRGKIKGVHIKDGFPADKPGQNFGRPACLGMGDAHIARIVNKLRLMNPVPPLLIECSGPHCNPAGITESASFLRSLVE